MPTVGISPPSRQRFFDAVGAPLAGGKVFTYAAGTTTKQNSYTDSTGATPNTNPIILDSDGYCDMWFDSDLVYKVTLSPATDVDPPTDPIWTVDQLHGSDWATLATFAASGGSALVGFIQAGTGAVARTAQAKMRDIVSVLDYGVVATTATSAVRAANTTAMRKLTATVANGGAAAFQFKGVVWFPNGDTYNLENGLPFRDGIHLELNGSTLNFSAADSTAMDQNGFLYARRDFSCKNGSIEIDYAASVGGRGYAIKLNPRSRDSDQGISQFFLTNFEEDQSWPPPAWPLVPMANRPGNMELRNLRLTSNNPNGGIIQILGGYEGIVMENLWFDGQSVCPGGIDYEFGFADHGGYPNDASPISHSVAAGNFLTDVRYRIEVVGTTDYTLIGSADNNVGTEFVATGAGTGTGIASHYWKSSHGCNLFLRNVHFINFDVANGTCFSMRGAYNVSVENFYADRCYYGISFGMGEAAFNYPGDHDTAGVKRNLSFRNIVINNHTTTAFSISGTTSRSGYLLPLAIQQQVDVEQQALDLAYAVLENFSFTGPGSGIAVSGGTISLRNGVVRNCSSGIFNSATRHLTLDDVDMYDCTTGIRNLVGQLEITGLTDRTLRIRGGDFCGMTGPAISFEGNRIDTVIEKATFGYNNAAEGRFTVTGGTVGAGNQLTSLKVAGVEILTGPGTPVPVGATPTATAVAIAVAINAYTATSNYRAFTVGAAVLIQDNTSRGDTINGDIVLPTVGGDMTVGTIKDMSGGKLDATQTYSVYVNALPALPVDFAESSVTIRDCNTRYATSGIAYGSNVALATGVHHSMVLENNRGITAFSGPWATDGASYTGTLTGCTTSPTCSVEYAQRGDKVFIHIGNELTATSNATTKTITGSLPSHMRPATNKYFVCLTKDNGGSYVAASGAMSTGGTITLYAGPNNNAFTAGGAFGVRETSFSYNL